MASISQPPSISVVVPTFNRRDELVRALEAVIDQDYPPECVEIVVIDNSSTDGTQAAVEALAARRGRAIGYLRKEPRGPVPARNRGAQLASGEWLLFVDSDVTLASDWMRRVTAIAVAQREIAAVGGCVVYATRPDLLNCFGGVMSRIGLCWDALEGSPREAASVSRDVLWMNTSATLVRRDVFLAIGGLDETFFYGYEEPDFGWRLALAGYRSVVVPDAVAHHHVAEVVGRSDPAIVFHYCKNRLRMILKNAGPTLLARLLLGYLAYSLVDLIARAPRGAKFRALSWNIRNLPGTLALRRQVQALRSVADDRIAALLAPSWFPPRRLAGQRRRAVDPKSSPHQESLATMRDDRVH